MKRNKLNLKAQDGNNATYYGKRNPEDGIICWDKNSYEIDRLIKASTTPHPGAYSYSGNEKIIIWKAKIYEKKLKGVVGRILEVYEDNSFVVQAKNGLIKVTKWESEIWHPKVGLMLGYNIQEELFRVKKELQTIKEFIKNLKIKS